MHFVKYHGTGNDFIIVDDRQVKFPDTDTALVGHLCHRRFGIGADGLMLLRPGEEGFDFEMVYFNSDGRTSSMCGNGGRCIAHFAHSKGLFDEKTSFLASDGPHEAVVKGEWVDLKMGNVRGIESWENGFVLNTGSPHYVCFVNDVENVNILEEGHRIRYGDHFRSEGINVNLVQPQKDGSLFVRTYERGVEMETYSCGTGVTAAAIARHYSYPDGHLHTKYSIRTIGGNLEVRFQPRGEDNFEEVWLSGPAVKVFEGEV